MSDIVTIDRHIFETERNTGGATGVLTRLLMDIALASKLIAKKVNKAGLVNILGKAGKMNIQGEVVTKLDVFANDTLIGVLSPGGKVCMLASEENDDPIGIPEQYPLGNYIVCFDPLDGSGNIDANVSVGTIFSIYKRVSPEGRPGQMQDVLQKGRDLVAAGYIIYGSSTMFVYTTGKGVHGFTLDPAIGEYILSHENIQTPKRSKIYSINEGNYVHFSKGVKKYIKYLQEEDPETGRPYSGRYIGSFVSDFHRNLLYGGIYMYPATAKNPRGKLRYLYEAAPLGFIAEQAGGRASDGKVPILDMEVDELHMRTPLFIGSHDDVVMAEEFIARYAD